MLIHISHFSAPIYWLVDFLSWGMFNTGQAGQKVCFLLWLCFPWLPPKCYAPNSEQSFRYRIIKYHFCYSMIEWLFSNFIFLGTNMLMSTYFHFFLQPNYFEWRKIYYKKYKGCKKKKIEWPIRIITNIIKLWIKSLKMKLRSSHHGAVVNESD